jgi:hypothetical protein
MNLRNEKTTIYLAVAFEMLISRWSNDWEFSRSNQVNHGEIDLTWDRGGY